VTVDLIPTTCACGFAGFLPEAGYCPWCGRQAAPSKERVNKVTGQTTRIPTDPAGRLEALAGTRPRNQTISLGGPMPAVVAVPALDPDLHRRVRGTSMFEILEAFRALQVEGKPTRLLVAERINLSESTLKRAAHDVGWVGWPPHPPEPDLR
jgi:hypothetical protein